MLKCVYHVKILSLTSLNTRFFKISIIFSRVTHPLQKLGPLKRDFGKEVIHIALSVQKQKKRK